MVGDADDLGLTAGVNQATLCERYGTGRGRFDGTFMPVLLNEWLGVFPVGSPLCV